MLLLTQNNLLVFGLAGDDSLGSAELSLKPARECARGGWPIGVVGRHNGQHAAEGGNERALHCVNTGFLQSLSLSWQHMLQTYNEHETPAGGDVSV